MKKKNLFLFYCLIISTNIQAQQVSLLPKLKKGEQSNFAIRVNIDTVQYLAKNQGLSFSIKIKNKTKHDIELPNLLYNPITSMEITLLNTNTNQKLPLKYFPRRAYQDRLLAFTKQFVLPFEVDSLFENKTKMKKNERKYAKDSKMLYLSPLQEVTMHLRITESIKSRKPLKYSGIPKGVYIFMIQFLVNTKRNKYLLFEKQEVKIQLK